MKTRLQSRQARLTLLGLALGILLALLIAPQTRWLVRLQTLTVLHQYHPLGCSSYAASPAADTRAYDAAAARHPDNLAVQYAQATFNTNAQPLMNLRALTHRFPNSPMLYANILREESSRLHLSSRADFQLSGLPVPKDVALAAASSPQDVAAYDKEAAAGERIDPENAYFPFMRAYGLFAAHHNAEALAAVERASVKPVWNEYLTENVEAQWRLHTEAFGDPGALPHSSILSFEMLPEYTRLREAARITVYQAVLKEQAGHLEEGFVLREALRRCGDLMRVQSTTLIGSLVGIAISTISETRPGGIPAPKDSPGLSPEQKAQRRLEIYCAYVTKIGHPEAARRARDEEAARRSVQVFASLDQPFPDFTGPLVHLTFWWMAGLALLLNAVWVLVLGLLAAGQARLPLTPKPPIGWKAASVQFVLAVGLWLLLAIAFVFVSESWIVLVYHAAVDWREASGVAGVLGLVAWLVASAMRRLPLSRRKSVLKTALLLPMLVGIGYGLFWLVQWVSWPLAELPQGLRALIGNMNNSDTEQRLQTQTLWICTAATLALPLLLAFVLSLAALVRRMPLSSALVSGFQRLAVPLTCLLVLVYGGLLVGTLRQERRVSEFNRQMVAEGGRYFAAQAGQSWPGPVQ